MILPLRLAWRDLRGGFGRFTIFIACLALGIAAISTVDTVSRGIELALREDGRAILGGDLTVRSVYAAATPEQLTLLRNLGDVSETATMRGMAIAGDNATVVELKAVDDVYPLYGTLDLLNPSPLGRGQGEGTNSIPSPFLRSTSPLGRGELSAIVAPEILDRLNLKQGDTFKLGNATLTAEAVIAREPDAAGSTGFVLGPRVLVSRATLEATGLIQPGSLVYWTYAIRLHPGVTMADAHKALIYDKAGAYGWQVRTYDHAAPSLQDLLDKLAQFLTLVGVSALIVGGIGIANAVKAALESRLQAIATMKCLGASRRLVFTIFLIEVLAMAAVGTLIGLIVGIGVPLTVGPALAAQLPIVPRLEVNAGTILSSLAYGFLITLIFALPTLFQAGVISPAVLFRSRAVPPPLRLTVMQMGVMAIVIEVFFTVLIKRSHDPALAAVFMYGLVAMIGIFAGAGGLVGRFAKWLQPYAPARAEVKLALANLHRPGNRTRDMMVSLGMGLAVLIAIGLVETNFRHELDARVTGEAPTFFFLDIQKSQFADFQQTVAAVPGASDFAATPSLRGRIAAVNGVPAEQALKDRHSSWILGSDRGITYSADLPKGSRLMEGAWWDGAPSPEPRLSITTAIARAFHIHPGDHMTLNIAGREITAVVANVREVNWGTFNINFTLVFAPGALEAAPQTFLATVHAGPEAKKQIARALARDFPSVSAIDVSEVLATVDAIMGKIANAVRVAALIILGTGVLVLLGAVSAGFEKRTGEAVVMKVLGVTRGRLFRIFLMEYGVLGFAAAVIALCTGSGASWWITSHIFSFDWSFYPRPAFMITFLGLAVTLAIGFAATLLVLGRKSAPYLRSE